MIPKTMKACMLTAFNTFDYTRVTRSRTGTR